MILPHIIVLLVEGEDEEEELRLFSDENFMHTVSIIINNQSSVMGFEYTGSVSVFTQSESSNKDLL